MKLKEIISLIEKTYPVGLAEEWDNVGLMVGDENREIKKILVSIEANEAIIEEAIQEQVDLIVTHHPFFFRKFNRITTQDYKGRLIHTLIHHDIAIYSMHTNFDIAKDGLNDYFMELMGFTKSQILDVTSTSSDGEVNGIGRVTTLNETIRLGQLAKHVKEKLSMDCVRVVGNLDKPIKTIAVVTGSGAGYMQAALSKQADVLITGDMKYHEAQDAVDAGLCVIDCNHFESENIFKDVMSRFLEDKVDVSVVASKVNLNPFQLV